MKRLNETHWSVDQTIGLMIDAVLSFGDLQRLRQAFSLRYDTDHDRCMHDVWLQGPQFEADDEPLKVAGRLRLSRAPAVRLPEPIPPIEKIRLRFKEIEKGLRIEVSEDGKVATHRFKDRLVGMHEEHKALGLIHPSCGTTPELAHFVTYTLDAFPVENMSIEHSGLFSSSLKVPSQSEAFFRILAAATIKETNSELNRMLARHAEGRPRLQHRLHQGLRQGYRWQQDLLQAVRLLRQEGARDAAWLRSGVRLVHVWEGATPEQRVGFGQGAHDLEGRGGCLGEGMLWRISGSVGCVRMGTPGLAGRGTPPLLPRL